MVICLCVCVCLSVFGYACVCVWPCMGVCVFHSVLMYASLYDLECVCVGHVYLFVVTHVSVCGHVCVIGCTHV